MAMKFQTWGYNRKLEKCHGSYTCLNVGPQNPMVNYCHAIIYMSINLIVARPALFDMGVISKLGS